MNDTARMTAAPDTAGAGHGAERKVGKSSLDELHQPLANAWQAVSEVARLVDEIHRQRGRRRIG